MYEAKGYSFELNEDMLSLLASEFDPGRVVERFAQAIAGKKVGELEDIGRRIFGEYGADMMKRGLQLGEEYSDRTYEVLRAASDKTGGYLAFPLIPQRNIEIAFLGVHELYTLPIIENSPDRFVFRMVDCAVNRGLKERCGQEVADLLPCGQGCINACEEAFTGHGIDVIARMDATMPKEGYCEFVIQRA